jgi:hypothetical protein
MCPTVACRLAWKAGIGNRLPGCSGEPDGGCPQADFTKDDDDHVQSSARVLGSENEASTAIQRLQDDKVLGCYRDQIEKRVKSIDEVKSGELKVKDVKLGQLSSDRYGDEPAAAQIVASLEANGISTDLYSNVVFVRQGRVLLLDSFVSQDSSFDADLAGRLVRAAAGRLEP